MIQYLTKEGLETLKKELEYLETTKRREIAERLKQAIAFGDLKENAAYHEAKETQGFLEGKIMDLKGIISDARVIEKSHDKNTVSLGSKIVVLLGEEKTELEIVGQAEANPMQGKISGDSPLGAELLRKRLGESGKLKIGNKETRYKILEIN